MLSVIMLLEERDKIIPYLNEYRSHYRDMRDIKFRNNVKPPLYFNPNIKSFSIKNTSLKNQFSEIDTVPIPEDKEDLAYFSRKIWVDKERFIALKENRYARSGKLLKTTEIDEVKFMENQENMVKQRNIY